MAKFVKKFLDGIFERNVKTREVGRVDGITLIDVRKRGGCFKTTIESSLHLIQQHDPRRYARVKRYISRIVNIITSDGYKGRYDLNARRVCLEFSEMSKLTHEDRAAIYACVLIDNSTRGILWRAQKRKPLTDYSKIENQVRIARIYVNEHNRFLEKLVEADLLPFSTFKLFRLEFDEKHLPKTSGKKKNFLKILFSLIRRAATERKIEKK